MTSVVVIEPETSGVQVVEVGEVGGMGGISEEAAVDAVADALVAGAGINIAYDDVGNTLTITNTESGGGGGGAAGHASFTFNSATTEPPIGNQLRINNASQTAATRMWISQTTTDGLDVTLGLSRILAGHQIYVQDYDDASKWVKYAVTADGVDDGTYWDFTVAYHSGPANVPFQTIELQPIAPGAAGLPPGGTTGQILTKTSSADYAAGWATGSGGGGIAGVVVQEGDTTVASSAQTLDFGAGFDVTESPAGEANVALDLSEYAGAALPVGAGGTGSTSAAGARTALGAAGTAAFTTSTAGLVPASGGGTTNYLRADGTFAAPAGGGGGIAGVTVAEGGAIIDTDIATLDFGNGFDLTESPENEVNITLDLGEYTGTALPQAGVSGLTTSLGTKVTNAGGVSNIRALTQAVYDGLGTYDAATLYVIT